MNDFDSLDQICCPDGFTFQKFEDHVIYFHLEFSSTTYVPEVIESIVIDTNLHVKLFYKVPLFHSQSGLDKDIFASFLVLICLKIFHRI